MYPQPAQVYFYATMRPISVCAGCDTPLHDREGATVKISEQIEDYCLPCFNATLSLPIAC